MLVLELLPSVANLERNSGVSYEEQVEDWSGDDKNHTKSRNCRKYRLDNVC